MILSLACDTILIISQEALFVIFTASAYSILPSIAGGLGFSFMVSAILLSACGRKEELYEIPDLSQYKTDYVGDSSNVINIVSSQEYPEGYSYDSIEIQSETEPYGLSVFLKDEPSASRIEDELQVNADMTFNLIGNLGTLDYRIADSKEIIASYER